MKTRGVLLLILLVFAFTPIITALATTFVLPTLIAISLAEISAYDIMRIQPMGDPILDPFPPG